MKPILVAALAVSLTASVAAAAPWTVDSYTINPGTFHSAVQYDETGDYVLVVQCHEESGAFEIYIESPIEWEDGSSYAPDVTTLFTIDGEPFTDVLFYFDERQMTEGIFAVPTDQAAVFEALLDALSGARETIVVSYFDKSATFPAEGAGEALLSLGGSCV